MLDIALLAVACAVLAVAAGATRVDHRGGGDFVAQFAQAEKKKGLLDVTISEARS